MVLFKKSADLNRYLEKQKQNGCSIGFVPTMGALHEGHMSLIKASQKTADITVCSIFVNPTQFNDPKDFEKYPSTIEKDILLLESNRTEVLFLPAVEEVYPDGRNNLENYDLGYLETLLEGAFRPGHFQGVCQVMSRLLQIVRPHHLFMGQKDYQQCMVIKKLIGLLDLKMEFHTCPTTRENDGLAMSSRNLRLNEEQRKNATGIYEALTFLKNHLANGDPEHLIQEAKKILESRHFRVDYVEIAGADDLRPRHSYDGREKLVALIAAFQDQVRLIDNMLLNE